VTQPEEGTTTMARYGYERVSTNDQNPEAQHDKLVAAGCDKIFTDKGQSGAKARRPEWDALLGLLAEGDQLVCVKLDRIGRSVRNLIEVTDHLQEVGADLVVLDQAIDTSTPTGKLLFHVLAAIAEFERGLIIERTLDGQAAVRRDGNLRRSLGGTPPLGFREGPEGALDWELDETAAEWLREAAQLVLDDPEHNIDGVYRTLDPITDATGRPVSVKMFRAALQRPASAGLITHDGQMIPAAIGGPLDKPTWTRLAVVFEGRKLGRPVAADRYPFGPDLRCAKCGNQLTGELVRPRTGDRAPVRYYSCRNPHKSLGVLKPCHGVSVAADDVEVLIRTAVEAWAQTPAARAAAARTPETASRRAELAAELDDLTDQLADLDAKRLRMRRNPSARARYEQLAAEVERMIATAEAELDQLEAIDAAPGVPVVIEWDAMNTTDKRRALAEAAQLPIRVHPGNGGGRAISAADRVDLFPRMIAA
jgi:DNA invertase Pin-like site-specific DNA recombinase